MRNLYLLTVLLVCSLSNANFVSDRTSFTGANYFLENADASISIHLGNGNGGRLHALDITLPAGLYHFKLVSMNGISYLGGSGFPSGSPTSYGFITIPAGTYNLHMGRGEYYNFVTVTDRMFEGMLNSYSLYDTGDGTYCAIDAVIATGYDFFMFHFLDVGNGTFYSVTSYPEGYLIDNGDSFTIPPGTYDICVTSDMAYSIVNKLNFDDFQSRKINVYPNPSQSEWHFKLTDKSIKSIKIYNHLGQVISENQVVENNYTFDCSQLLTGIYYAHLVANDVILVVKLIKN